MSGHGDWNRFLRSSFRKRKKKKRKHSRAKGADRSRTEVPAVDDRHITAECQKRLFPLFAIFLFLFLSLPWELKLSLSAGCQRLNLISLSADRSGERGDRRGRRQKRRGIFFSIQLIFGSGESWDDTQKRESRLLMIAHENESVK